MDVRIIRPGDLVRAMGYRRRLWRFECPACGCVFEQLEGGIRVPSAGICGVAMMSCPWCAETAYGKVQTNEGEET